jgi:hypothetical protein
LGSAKPLVDHETVRRAVGGFAAEPNLRTSLEVLRSCMYGELLFDITGSDPPVDGAFPAGSRLQFRGGAGPDGGRALFAFTRIAEIAKLYPPGTHTQSMVTPASGALGFARQRGDAWLYIDPAGPTCALGADQIDFALRNPSNEPLKAAIAAVDAGQVDRQSVLQLLKTGGPMLVAADDRSVPGKVGYRTMPGQDGSACLLAFTSAPEVVAFNPSDAVVSLTTGQVIDMARRMGQRGIVVNPARPALFVSLDEISS